MVLIMNQGLIYSFFFFTLDCLEISAHLGKIQKSVYGDGYKVNEFGYLGYICSLSSSERQALKIKLSPLYNNS